MIIRSASRLSVAAVAIFSGLILGLGDATAAPMCAPLADVCVIVNSNLDTNLRDDAMTLREALMVQNGSLEIARLTRAERLQVNVATNLGMRGSIEINFDAAVFCHECAANVILIEPPGLSDPDRYTGTGILALPPGLSDPDGAPPRSGRLSVVGMGVVGGQRVPLSVVVDGSRLTTQHVGLWLGGKGSVQGMTFQNFAGRAIEIDGKYAHDIVIGSDGDGSNDVAEAVHFVNNGADVIVLPRK